MNTRLLTSLVKERGYDISKQLLDVEGFLAARILFVFNAFENVLCLRTNGRKAGFQRLPPAPLWMSQSSNQQGSRLAKMEPLLPEWFDMSL